MSLPTLLKKDTIIPHMGEKKNEISNIKAIDFIMNWFKPRIDNPSICKKIDDKIIIIKSATGSGKSTTLPAEFYLRFNKILKKNIIVTQPRILTTISVPKDIAEISSYKPENRSDNTGIVLYKNIGYQTKEYVRKPLEKGILFCTIGVLLQYLKNIPLDIFINKYGIIILDEAHIRTNSLDLIFYYMKKIYNTNKIENLPFLIITSATMDIKKYANYFKTKTIFEVIGTSYPIQTFYLNYNSVDLYNTTIDIVKSIHSNKYSEYEKNKSDIIIFVPGKSYINKIKDKIIELNKNLELNNQLLPIILDSENYKLSGINYQYLFEDLDKLSKKKEKYTKKVIIATNVAEVSITINSLKYCIDIGLYNQLEYNPNIGTNLLITKPVTQSMAIQRKGRVGRKFAGIFFPVYTEHIYNQMQNIQLPDIYLEDFTLTLLNILIIKYDDIINKYISLSDIFNSLIEEKSNYEHIKFLKNIENNINDLLDNPTKISIIDAMNKLYLYGAIYANGYPTKLGLLINKTRNLSIENMKMILSGYYYKCNIIDLVTIAAFNQINKSKLFMKTFKSFNNQFIEIKDKNLDNYNYNKLKSRLIISCDFIDFLLFFNKFKSLLDNNLNIHKLQSYCEENRIVYSELLNLIKLREDIIQELLFNMNLNPYENKNDINLLELINLSFNNKNKNSDRFFIETINEIIKIKHCLYEGFKLNIAIYNKYKDKYFTYKTNKELEIDSYLVKNLPILNNGTNFETNKPKIILYDGLLIKKNSLTNNYNYYISNSISVLSGYINVDNQIES